MSAPLDGLPVVDPIGAQRSGTSTQTLTTVRTPT